MLVFIFSRNLGLRFFQARPGALSFKCRATSRRLVAARLAN